MSEECLICGAPLTYLDRDEPMECTVCHKKEDSKTRCVNGHYVCSVCHTQGMDVVIGLCLGETSKDPIAILERMMAQPFCHMHGPEHHVMVGAALLTAYKNAGGELDLPAALQEMYSRGKDVPGGACGFWGACGAGISAGIFASIVSKATPLAAESFGLAHQMTSRALESIGMVGGPRCCKRDSYLSILTAVDFAAENWGIAMDSTEVVCRHAAQNNQCIGKRCPFAAANHRGRAAGTEKLYYADSFLAEFTAKVLSCEETKEGWAVVLDRTAFYPEGGGQPADHGTLGGVAVTDVREKEGVIRHLCAAPLPAGETVEGCVDFQRRFDFMQQHSGEHIVSGILCGRFHCDNVGFHIGRELVTIDFNAALSEEDVREVERLANCYIWEDHAVEISYPSPEQLAQLDYRSKKELSGQVRIVTWPGADCCACCGTHVQRSGQVGQVKLLSCQKFRDGVRIEMAAGGRALKQFTTISEQNTRISQLLSAKAEATAAAVERLQREAYELRGRVAALEEGDFARKAAQYAGAGDVLLMEGAMSGESVRKLCGTVQESCGGRCAVFAGEDGRYQYAASHPEGDLRPLAKAINSALDGRGGGKPAFIQGSVQASAAEIRTFWDAQCAGEENHAG